ncbi:UNVERIFIED_CONTAM: hypothetical protein FKN15_073780 [Acipenser sinensis]
MAMVHFSFGLSPSQDDAVQTGKSEGSMGTPIGLTGLRSTGVVSSSPEKGLEMQRVQMPKDSSENSPSSYSPDLFPPLQQQ